MKPLSSWWLFGLALALILPVTARSAPSNFLQGTILTIELREKLTTRKTEQGEEFEAILTQDWYQGKRLIAPKDSRVRGKVIHLQEGQERPQAIRAEMELVLTEIKVDRTWHPMETKPVFLHTEKNFTALKVIGPAAAGTFLAGVKGAAAGTLIGVGWALITKDRQIVLRKKTQLQFKVKRAGKLRRQIRRAR
ncbi:MAG: hypothetical protein AAF804_08260 [Bacteroidota bacterium]